MLPEDKYFYDLTEEEVWERYCGFFDLSIREFMKLQEYLLMDEIEFVAGSGLGKKIMKEKKPASMAEFRHMVPLTTYEDYEPYLSERQEDCLAKKPFLWCHSAGRGGNWKWVPHSAEVIEIIVRHFVGCLILASSESRGRVNIKPNLRLLATTPPPPYASGSIFHSLAQSFSLRLIPPPELAEKLEFQERIEKGFQLALRDGVDIIGAIASILVKIGEGFSERTRSVRFSPFMLHPKVLYRFMRAWRSSKSERRQILPKDLWSPKGIIVGGMDTDIYRDAVAYYWGSKMHEIYSMTEAPLLAMQNWNKKAMTFVPNVVFLEFIPIKERVDHDTEAANQPATVLLDELEEDGLYEVVITQLYGMPLLRYRTKDLIKVVALKDNKAQVNLPQIEFQRRADEIINLAALCQLDEKTIWRAIANSGIKYVDWAACKEYDHSQSFLRLYVELKEERKAEEIAIMVDEQLKQVDVDYRDIGSYLAQQPVRVTLLAPGTFLRYIEAKRGEGADLAHIKPNHINPPESVVQRLLQFSKGG